MNGDDVRLRQIGSRLTYANVMATVAVFLALGGGAYALTGIPDRGGVYHACVDPKAGALRVVKTARSCRKTKTVRRGTRRVRILGESAIAWNQQGPRGATGQGVPGQNGAPGAPGSALAFAHVNSDGTLDTANSKNVVDVRPDCNFPCASPPPPAASGFQCFNVVGSPHSAVVSTEVRADKSAGRVTVPGPLVSQINSGCPAGYTSAEVFTFDTTTGIGASAGFYVVFN
jgi:hypothetical protein